MKKLFLTLSFVAVLSAVCSAEEVKVGNVLDKIPALKQGVGFSVVDNKFNYLTTMEIATIGKYINIEGGYAGNAENSGHKLVGVLSVNLLEGGDIQFPVLKYLKFNPGLYAGYGSINMAAISNAEFDYGLSATLLEVKF